MLNCIETFPYLGNHILPAMMLHALIRKRDWDNNELLNRTLNHLEYGVEFLSTAQADDIDEILLEHNGNATFPLAFDALRRLNKVQPDDRWVGDNARLILVDYLAKLQQIRFSLIAKTKVTVPDESLDELSKFFEQVYKLDEQEAANNRGGGCFG